ncbi:hypothetical protein G6O69_09625 [Pseudenhygromyxa sp. WMMC2535]|uniref:hypothetical protein n=1 Tax=Pseudenhygromyxa sp. WMMC2535 TaxID=2712867 RepID=UPI00155360E6|nr:hypothetical protein [Pseudenhygromyxa sp. WMMC2535]NVB38090.1 hypothetical protein [Pseudenhygromyxa sp. WMMC2535]
MLLPLQEPPVQVGAPKGEPREGSDELATERHLQVQFVSGFEGWSLITIACDHQPMWLVSELARVLGFVNEPNTEGRLEEGKAGVDIAVAGLLTLLAQRWQDRVPSGAVAFIEGGERRGLLEKLDHAQVVLGPEHRRKPLVLIGMAAIDELVATLNSAVGRRLRTHLRERVTPEFHAWERAARAFEQPILSPDAATIAANRLEFERRCFEAAVLERLLDRLERDALVDNDRVVAHRVVASDIALGGHLEDHEALLSHGWSTPTQIAQRWSALTAMRVGRLIAHLGLKGSRAHSRAVITKARGHERTVVSYVYSPAAVALIERELSSRGFRRCACAELEARGDARWAAFGAQEQ